MDALYEMDASSNLVDWQALGTVLATNIQMPFADSNAVSAAGRFYRAVTMP